MQQEPIWFTPFVVLAVLVVAVIQPRDGAAASKYEVLQSLSGNKGANPFDSLIFDDTGNLYGTAYGGGIHNHGVVFKLMPNSDGSWTESVLHNFGGSDGRGPVGGVVFDDAG